MNATITDSVMADAEIEAYREKGFVVVEDIYSAGEVARMREVLDGIVDAARGVRTTRSTTWSRPTRPSGPACGG